MCNIHCTAIVIINIFGKIITGLRTSFKKYVLNTQRNQFGTPNTSWHIGSSLGKEENVCQLNFLRCNVKSCRTANVCAFLTHECVKDINSIFLILWRVPSFNQQIRGCTVAVQSNCTVDRLTETSKSHTVGVERPSV